MATLGLVMTFFSFVNMLDEDSEEGLFQGDLFDVTFYISPSL
jgi:hypothetical protein